ncbi:hypothetical protein [Bacillus thermotolerans]|uniref:Uncharacterized protein n=1 Tax=Bacillus thermotolerans TaxID=1221996 RepID=A0A0F5HXM2_BACTR|nr:hypothetical protein [Bacillus thermotolerans]KKB37587.1 hypothetical protein QY97_03950 [Bacillus thermotolerans]KKB42185.1 hypothetical protein QY96_01466 [Bacillus thermotolerans]KKB43286.1 hypothetical protein QY95_01531 [Bacillus thermotolerans]
MYFQLNRRLGIRIPHLPKSWEEHSSLEQARILHEWENIRGAIPDRIKELERQIQSRQSQLDQEEDFLRSCRLNEEISDIASIINDLWIWFRTTPSVNN